MGPSTGQRGAQSVLALRFLRALRTGALVGLVPGLLAGALVLVTGDGDVAGAAVVGTLVVAGLGLGFGFVLCVSAFLAALALGRLDDGAHLVTEQSLRLQRGLLGTGAAGASACLVVLAVVFWQADRLY